jgi:hypothetical protein
LLIEETKKALDALGFDYRQGSNYFQLSCPFWKQYHSRPDRNPSFVIYPEYNICKCYSCSVRFSLADCLENCALLKGKDINFDHLVFKLDFKVPEEATYSENIELEDQILSSFLKNSKKAEEYLESRGINPRYIKYPLYYDSLNNNILAPVRNYGGSLVGATGRFAGPRRGHHHYFGMLTSKALLGLEQHSNGNILIVEGLTDFLNSKDKINKLNLDLDVYATMTCNLDNWQAIEIIDLGKPVYLAWDQEVRKNKRDQALKKLKNCIRVYDCEWDFPKKEGGIKDIGDFTYEEFEELFGFLKKNS